MQQLENTEFDDVVLGATLFDPATGKKFQKVDEVHRGRNIYGSEYNAVGEDGMKNFGKRDVVKAHESKLKKNRE